MGFIRRDALECLGRILGLAASDHVGLLFDQAFQHLADQRMIVHQEDLGLGGARHHVTALPWGIRQVSSAPPKRPRSTRKRPPIILARSAMIRRPMPSFEGALYLRPRPLSEITSWVPSSISS